MMLDLMNPNSSRYPDIGDIASDRVLRTGDMTQTILSTGRAASYGSIEGIHGDYHSLIGGENGHMGHPSIAAFDPVFWLHHCNVDRIFAIWQALHPNAWFPPAGRDARGRPMKPENEKDLLPFYKYMYDLGPIYYDSDWARDTEKLGYTYPDLDRMGSTRAIWSGVYYRYIWSVRRTSSRRFSKPPSDMMPLNLNRAQVFQYPESYSRSSANDSSRHGTTRIIYKRVVSSDFEIITTTRTTEQLAQQDNGYLPAADNPIDPYFNREWYIDNIVKRFASYRPQFIHTNYSQECPQWSLHYLLLPLSQIQVP